MTKVNSALRGCVTKSHGHQAYFKPETTVLPVAQVVKDLCVVNRNLGGQLSPSEDFKWSYLLDSLLSKYAFPGVSPSQRENAAIAKMLKTEEVCHALNERGILKSEHTFSAERFNTVIQNARNIITDVLGEFSYEIFSGSKFSAGASTSRLKHQGDPYFKYSSHQHPIDVTKSAYPYAVALVRQTPAWSRFGMTMKIVSGNRIFTVPKKTEIDRCCAKEPDMNLALQRAVGLHIRSQLLGVRIDLSDQSRNQRLALRGSRYDDLATIDLSSASDSISTAIVEELLPDDWFQVLSDLRSPEGQMPNGKKLLWSKFSSMGNGFTFELESLIFYSLTQATLDYERGCGLSCPGTISIYGDDIICPSIIATNVISVLAGCGFATNDEKTFIKGPFRESCGKHYYDGIDVTPFYIKQSLDSLSRVIWLCNRLRIWSYCKELSSCDDTLYGLWRKYSRLIPARLKGGRNIETIDSLYGPGKSQDKLVYLSTRRKFRADAAYLRAFQNQQTSWQFWSMNLVPGEGVHLFYRNIEKDNPGLADFNSNVVVNPLFARYKPNKELWRPRTYLFSKEM